MHSVLFISDTAKYLLCLLTLGQGWTINVCFRILIFLFLILMIMTDWEDKEEGKEVTQQWEDDWDDDDVNDDFSLQLRKELENNSEKS